ncbi:MAG TPA: tRNA dihydrouridine synthase DusB [Candidatus Polarisedimenticolia bacterium]|nr:tRNA dihydrouridine synthase DusB [Candidatus Polarisedimenticolia bacterium]
MIHTPAVSDSPGNRAVTPRPPMRIGTVTLEEPLILAPMAGITDQYFRLILKRVGGVGLVTMEFISSEALTRGSQRTRHMMQFCEEERPLAIQIYGSDPSRMAEAAAFVEALGGDIVDINMGCPANKVLKGCSGAALMGDLPLARAIVAAARKAVRIPLTVKFRLGLDSTRANYLELGKICQEEGADAVALHARTARQMFSGQPDRERIRDLKQKLRIPVSGNGDIETPDDALALWHDTGCDGVMIGRAAIKNPWIFRQIAQRRAGRPAHQATLEERRDLIAWHFGLLRERETEEFALHKIRTFTGWYTHGLPNGRVLRQKINSLPSTAHFMDALEQFFAEAIAAPAEAAGAPLVPGAVAPALGLTAQTA